MDVPLPFSVASNPQPLHPKPSAVEQTRHIQDSQDQILVLAFR